MLLVTLESHGGFELGVGTETVWVVVSVGATVADVWYETDADAGVVYEVEGFLSIVFGEEVGCGGKEWEEPEEGEK